MSRWAGQSIQATGQGADHPGGGGVLGPEKDTDCGPTAAEWWLSRQEMPKKGGLFSYYIV